MSRSLPLPPSPSDSFIGQTIQQRYRVIRKIGDGGMGSVYEAEHLLIRKRVAIKVLHSQFAENAEVVARFQREAQAASAIGHPNIVEVTDMGRLPNGTFYMVLEYLEGRDWAADIDRQGPQRLGKIAHILIQVCDALEAAHAKGIIHRDIKPENVFLVQRDPKSSIAKVLDFGISKIQVDGGNPQSLTQTGSALGTPYYMAPEQCQGTKDIDHRADIYALGVVLFQALTGQYPFDDTSYPMLVLKICTEAPPPLSHWRLDIPDEIQELVSRMLAKRREQRISSCGEVRQILERYLTLDDEPSLPELSPNTAEIRATILNGARQPVHTPNGTLCLEASPPRQSTSNQALPNRRSFPLKTLGFCLLLLGAFVGTCSYFVSDALFENTTPEVATSRPTSNTTVDEPPEDDEQVPQTTASTNIEETTHSSDAGTEVTTPEPSVVAPVNIPAARHSIRFLVEPRSAVSNASIQLNGHTYRHQESIEVQADLSYTIVVRSPGFRRQTLHRRFDQTQDIRIQFQRIPTPHRPAPSVSVSPSIPTAPTPPSNGDHRLPDWTDIE